ncbi:putative nuclease HARBI1 isoform X2 [Orussus abietinus]|uniref:putative nuclease HARBI1 isoform X2 n=1 Tax=Orussus abietinus TaxID=222816 RepID=UPI000626AC06|nr:putative nuclease HARBI1 isoform X2 [Orussus abietinus]
MTHIPILMIFDDEWEQGNRPTSMRMARRTLRDSSDPFAVPENEFRSLYRLSKDAVWALIDELRPFMPVKRRITAIPIELQILVALNFMATGSYQRRIGQDFLTCMSQAMISKSLHATVNGLNQLMKKWIAFPVSDAKLNAVKQGFFEFSAFPGIIGVIDSTHIAIVPPEAQRGHLFINRKQYHSLNVLVVSDYKGEILAVNAAHGGRTHDAKVFQSSRLFAHLTEQYENGRKGLWLLGDSAYPLLPFLLTPKLDQQEGTPGAKYTNHHIRACEAVKRCLGVLKGRWRCLRKERALHYQPEFAALIVNACCVLNNIAIRWRISEDEIYMDEIDTDPPELYENIDMENGEQARNQIIEWYFTD